MDTVLFGFGLLVAAGAFYLLTRVSKLRHAIQQNIDTTLQESAVNDSKPVKAKKAKVALETA